MRQRSFHSIWYTRCKRIKLIPFIFVVIRYGIIYPIQGAWQWGGGWLAELGFSGFAGSSIVHSTGGWADSYGCSDSLAHELADIMKDGTVNAMPGSSMPLTQHWVLSSLWLGWFGFNRWLTACPWFIRRCIICIQDIYEYKPSCCLRVVLLPRLSCHKCCTKKSSLTLCDSKRCSSRCLYLSQQSL